MASMAQYYSDNLKTEVKKGIVERFENGYHMATPPYGYEVRSGLKVMRQIPQEAEVIKTIFSLYATCKYSFNAIGDKIFKENNYKTKNGKKFSKSRIQAILNNVVFYMGQIEYKKIGKKTKGLHKPIVSPTLFMLAKEIMEARRNVKKSIKGKYDFLYKGFVSCPYCNKTLYAGYSTGGSGKKHLYYTCRDKSHGAVNIKETDIQRAFNKIIESLRITNDTMDIITDFVGKKLEEKEQIIKKSS